MTSIADRKLRMSRSRHANKAEQMFIADSVHIHKPNQDTTVYLYSDLSYLKVTTKKALALQSDGLAYEYQTRHHNNFITCDGNNFITCDGNNFITCDGNNFITCDGNNWRMSKKVDNQGLHDTNFIRRTRAPESVNEVSQELGIFSTLLLVILVYILTFVVSFGLFSIIYNGVK